MLGIGDDAAVVSGLDQGVVLSVDTSVEGVHFDRRFLDLESIGYRSFQAAASDLAAMGASAVGALSSLIVPSRMAVAELDEIVRGQAEASRECRCPVIGGNLSKGGELSITTTVVGQVDRPLTRSGARVGEEVWVVGALGLAAAGLACSRLGMVQLVDPAVGQCVSAWARPRALLERGLALRGLASSCIDVSDGLSRDLARLARASGAAMVVNAGRLSASLSPSLRLACRRLRRSPTALAIAGGEDYALLATGPSSRRPSWARAIGRVQSGAGAWLARDGRKLPLAGGYDHFG